MKKIMNIKQKISIIIVLLVVGFIYAQALEQTKQVTQMDKDAELVLDDIQEESIVVRVTEEERLATENVSVDVLENEEDNSLTEEILEQLKRDNLITNEVLANEELYNETDVDAFFADAIFVGDSVTVGLSNYYRQNQGSVFTDSTQFLAQVGCSALMCISDNPTVRYAKYMPSFQGTLCTVEDGVAASGAKKVFIDYGLNDLVGCTPDEYFVNMVTLVNRIIEKSPDVQIYVIGTTYVVNGSEKAYLTNENIHTANEKMKTYCQEVGWGYLNIADYLADNNGTLQSIYSSDQYVHQNTQAYEIWVKVLRTYAKRQIEEPF